MGRHTSVSKAMGAPASAEEAAERFLMDTGVNLSSDPLFTKVHQHMFTWRVVLAVAEYEPLVHAIEAADQLLRSRSVRAIPKFKPIPLTVAGTEEQAQAQRVADALALALGTVSEGLVQLKKCIGLAKESGLIGKVKVGRPEDALHRALCLLLVELVERGGGPERLTATQAALVAQAYGVAAPTGTWKDWLERWRRLMNEARAEEPGTKTPRQRLIQATRVLQKGLNPKG